MTEFPPLPPDGPEAPRLISEAERLEADRVRRVEQARYEVESLKQAELERQRVERARAEAARHQARRSAVAKGARTRAAAVSARRKRTRRKGRAKKSKGRATRFKIAASLLTVALVVAGLVFGTWLISRSGVQAETPVGTVSPAQVSLANRDAAAQPPDYQGPRMRFGVVVQVRTGGTEFSVWNITVHQPVSAGTEGGPNDRYDVLVRLAASSATELPALSLVDDPWLFRSDDGDWVIEPWDTSACGADQAFEGFDRTRRFAVRDELTWSFCVPAFGGHDLSADPGFVLKMGNGEIVFSESGTGPDPGILDRSVRSLGEVGFTYGTPVPVEAGDASFPSVWNISVGSPTSLGRTLGQPEFQGQSEVITSFTLDAELVESHQSTDRLAPRFDLIGGATGTIYPVVFGQYPCVGPFQVDDTVLARVGYTSTSIGCTVVSGADAASSATVVTSTNSWGNQVVFRSEGTGALSAWVERNEPPQGRPLGSLITFDQPMFGESTTGEWTVRSSQVQPSESTEWNEVNIVVGFAPAESDRSAMIIEQAVYVLGGAMRQMHQAPCNFAADPERVVVVADGSQELAWCVRVPAVDGGHPDTRIGLKVGYNNYVFVGPE